MGRPKPRRVATAGVHDEIKAAFQDMIAPELHALRGDIQRLAQRIEGVDARLTIKIDSLRSEAISAKAELLAEIRRLNARVDAAIALEARRIH